jgi:hypothetical protein
LLAAALLAFVLGSGGASASAAGHRARPPATFAAFTGHGAGFSFTFSKPQGTTRRGARLFEFPGRLQIASVKAPLYTLVSVFLVYYTGRPERPSLDAQAVDIQRRCLGQFFVTHRVPSKTAGWAYECRPNLSEWTCTSDLERGNVRVAISVTAPSRDQCVPYERLFQRIFFKKAGIVLG